MSSMKSSRFRIKSIKNELHIKIFELWEIVQTWDE